MKLKRSFVRLSPTTQRLILDMARDLPWGRFLACVSPSACKEIMEPDVALENTFNHEIQVFCEQVCRLCRDVEWAKKYLLKGQSLCRQPHITINPCDWKGDRHLAERLYYYTACFLPHDHGWSPDNDSIFTHAIPETAFKLECAVERDGQYGLCILEAEEEPRKLDESLKLTTLVGTLQDWDGASISRGSLSRHNVDSTLWVKFPMDVPAKPPLPVKLSKSPMELGLATEVLKERIEAFYAPWHSQVRREMENIFRAKSLGFVFD